MGTGVLEDECLCAVPDLAVAQRPRMGEAADGQSGHCLRGSGQRLSLLRSPRGVAETLQSTGPGSDTRLLRSLVPATAHAVFDQGPRGGLPVRVGLSSVRGL